MSEEKRFSDEFLNAFVDNQLAAEEKGRVYLEINQDETLNRQVCELRKLHDLVQLAYQNPPAPPARQRTGARAPRSNLRFGVAASLLLVLGALLGTQTELLLTTHAPVTVDAVPAAPPSRKNATLAARVNTTAKAPAANAVAVPLAMSPRPVDRTAYGNPSNKVLIHIANDDTTQLGQALDEVENLLRYYRTSRQNARVEVVINGKGLELVRVDTSAFAERIQQLQREFDNLTFAACQNTIDRLKREQGILVRLLPGVVVIDSGVAELMRRQNQGWTYIQV